MIVTDEEGIKMFGEKDKYNYLGLLEANTRNKEKWQKGVSQKNN